MYCVNCGAQFEGNFCSNCGTPVNGGVAQNQGGTLEISRPSEFWGFAAKLTVKIDGYPYSLGAGKLLSFSLTPGVHTVSYKFWCRREKSVQVQVMAGGNYSVVFAYDWLWGGFKVSPTSKLQ